MDTLMKTWKTETQLRKDLSTNWYYCSACSFSLLPTGVCRGNSWLTVLCDVNAIVTWLTTILYGISKQMWSCTGHNSYNNLCRDIQHSFSRPFPHFSHYNLPSLMWLNSLSGFSTCCLSSSHFYPLCVQKNPVLFIGEEQPKNWFTELQVLKGHFDIVRFLVQIDDFR